MRKRILALLMALLMMGCVLAGCSSEEKTDDTAPQEDTKQEDVVSEDNTGVNEKKDIDVASVVSAFSEDFAVDVTTNGEVKENSFSINSNRVVLDGDTYSFPIEGQKFFDNGWAISDSVSFDDSIDPGESTIIGLPLEKYVNTVEVTRVFNVTEKTSTLKDSYITGIILRMDNISEYDDFVVAGGITQKSKASDVIAYFGSPEDSTEFSSGSVGENSLMYYDNEQSNLTYTFEFKDDGRIDKITISYIADF